MRVIVIGGGASGMMAAISAAQQGAAVTVLEKMDKPGKKLLITGNGRCNLTNLSFSSDSSYYGSHEAFIETVISQFTVYDTLSFFRKNGLLTRERNDLVYPYTDQAASVLEILLQQLRKWKVKLKYLTPVKEIEKKDGIFYVKTEGWTYEADRVILCTGSKAAPQTGAEGDGYRFAEACGHSIKPVLPALVPLKIKGELPGILSGTRNYVNAAVVVDGTVKKLDTGEVQWTDYGISGIVIFQLSRFASVGLYKKKKVHIHMDLMPEYSQQTLLCLLDQKITQNKEQSYEELLTGFLKKKNILAVTRLMKTKPSAKADSGKFELLISLIKNLCLEVTDTRSFDVAQVCAGGVPETEVNVQTLESLKMPGLYLAGELLDVDGICGGYNLQWAWSSGYVAGHYAGKGVTE